MGQLSEFTPRTLEVEVPGTGFSLTLRGLGVSDMSVLIARHGEQLAAAATRFSGAAAPQVEIAKVLLEEAPAAVYDAIAIANDQPDHARMVARLPATVLVECLAAVAELTFVSEEAVGKALEIVAVGSHVLTRLISGQAT